MASMNDGKTSKLPVREYPAGSKIRIRVVRNWSGYPNWTT